MSWASRRDNGKKFLNKGRGINSKDLNGLNKSDAKRNVEEPIHEFVGKKILYCDKCGQDMVVNCGYWKYKKRAYRTFFCPHGHEWKAKTDFSLDVIKDYMDKTGYKSA